VSIVLAILAGATPQPAVFFRPFVTIQSRGVTLKDVAELKALPVPLRTKAAQLVLFQMHEGQRYVQLPTSQLASRARSLLPALRAWLPSQTKGAVVVMRPSQEAVRMIASAPSPSHIVPGAAVNVSVYSGAIRIDLGATALQKGRVGHYFFARSQTGQLLRLECCGE
jgi:hypothetical protein